MKKFISLLLILALLLSACGQNTADTALVPKPLAPNDVAQNPYMASSENSVHNDSYSSDVSNAVFPLCISPELTLALETKNMQAPSAAFYDELGAAVTPFNGGVAIADIYSEVITRKGVFVPALHDTEQYRVQISYAFVDSDNNVVLPTTHGHVIVLQTYDENGNVLPVFKKVLDVNVVEYAKKALGDDIDTRLLSIVYDYSGNLWFVTGGFRIVPSQNPAGFIGYLSREYIDKILSGEQADAAQYLHFLRLDQGESAENGISSSENGAVILTNMACYMLRAENGVSVVWKTPYESNGTNDAQAGSDFTGGGLAYGSGTTPTLTKDLVLFTDNLDPVNLLALSSETGEIVASSPVLDTLGQDIPVSVENSILVYSASPERTSVIICNWFGAGNAGLSDPNADSAVQSYANLYDANWMRDGNKYIAPGVERIDVVKTDSGYTAEKVWLRSDISDTSMLKLSTAAGYVYGYWQNMDTKHWCYEILDFESGKTVCELPVSDNAAYNNMAVGMINDAKGNALYCPTNAMDMVCLADDFVYFPDFTAKRIPTQAMGRKYITADELGGGLLPASYLMSTEVTNLIGTQTIAFKLNGLDKSPDSYTLLFKNADGALSEFDGEWAIYKNGVKVTSSLNAADVVELRFDISDGDEIDTNAAEKNVAVCVILVK